MSERVLVFAPHNDDEVLGAGGTIAKLAKQGAEIMICEVTSGTNPERVERIKSEARRAHALLGAAHTVFLELPVVRLTEHPRIEINARMCEVVKDFRPTIAFIPHMGDMHTDHRVTADAAMVALRPYEAKGLHSIYVYETLSETEWNIPSAANAFIPNAWCDISDELATKLDAMRCYETQLNDFPHPRSTGALEALARYRGSTVGADAAEAFMLIRHIF
jgi:LmbE family N-acetylglucosaminyl deacetylase